jgi:hypothetical protein
MANLPDNDERKPSRRRILQILGAGGAGVAIGLPARWTRPIVEAIVVPAHAAASPSGTSTTSTSTTPRTTTTPAPSTTTPVPSDIRLKRDIGEVGRLSNGLGLYRYRYVWSDETYVGVMAQEVEKIDPDAVVRGADGFLRVDYGRLGLRLMTFDEWASRAAGAGTTMASGKRCQGQGA